MKPYYSNVNIRQDGASVSVKIGGHDRPDINEEVRQRWQSKMDVLAKILDVPSGLIMKLNKDTIEVFLKSETPGNPYKAGEREALATGLYCETVIGKQDMLLVPDATKSEIWSKNNPDIDLNMISYLGFPVNWPDGEVFGTVCVLDSKEQHYNENQIELLRTIKESIESDLDLLISKYALEKRNQRLEQSNELKTKFLTIISHDLRGSVGTLNEFLKIVINDFDQMERDRLLHSLRSLSQNTNDVYQTLLGLLSWSRSELFQLEARLEEVDLVKLIDKVLALFIPRASLKNIALTKEYQVKELLAEVDIKMFETIVRNLLSNAIKYNDSGGQVKVRLGQNDKRIVLEVEDDGVGISDEAKELLFSETGQVETDSHNSNSFGIGLQLVREFVNKHNGSITVESEPDTGSKFTILL
ncbi:MAG: GAF domain-containing sensor histidine kinase [Bacteroidota bacterium]